MDAKVVGDHFVPKHIAVADVLRANEAVGGLPAEVVALAPRHRESSICGANTRGGTGAGSDGVGTLRLWRVGHQPPHGAVL